VLNLVIRALAERFDKLVVLGAMFVLLAAASISLTNGDGSYFAWRRGRRRVRFLGRESALGSRDACRSGPEHQWNH
jgi:hypothetical protein